MVHIPVYRFFADSASILLMLIPVPLALDLCIRKRCQILEYAYNIVLLLA